MSKKLIQIMAVAALSAAASLPAFAGDMNNALGGALGGVAGAAVGGAVGGSTGAVIGGAVGGGAGGAVTSNRRERTGAIIGGALGGGAGTAAGNAMGGRGGGLIGAAVGGGAAARARARRQHLALELVQRRLRSRLSPRQASRQAPSSPLIGAAGPSGFIRFGLARRGAHDAGFGARRPGLGGAASNRCRAVRVPHDARRAGRRAVETWAPRCTAGAADARRVRRNRRRMYRAAA
ncbi:hypothetical protein BBMA_776 [Burkholderia pseudomallei MSHR1079]|nr:hypothetical protein BBMA_776 [Burkholderia pseudomallei MSHR1079]